ncbi:MAG: hypothetical protein P4L64_10830 [Caulobacteraceae bacterium]|nr:hypothetical protein [Caulobacteraceae bacterium]
MELAGLDPPSAGDWLSWPPNRREILLVLTEYYSRSVRNNTEYINKCNRNFLIALYSIISFTYLGACAGVVINNIDMKPPYRNFLLLKEPATPYDCGKASVVCDQWAWKVAHQLTVDRNSVDRKKYMAKTIYDCRNKKFFCDAEMWQALRQNEDN